MISAFSPGQERTIALGGQRQFTFRQKLSVGQRRITDGEGTFALAYPLDYDEGIGLPRFGQF